MSAAGRLAVALDRGAERVLGPIDAARRALYRVAAPVAAPWFARREVRIGAYGALVAATSLAGAVLAPLWLLALGPLLLGVPHLVADLRYLVARPRLHERPAAPWVAGALAATVVTLDLRWGLLGGALGVLGARAPWPRRLVAAAPLLALAAALTAWSRPVGVGLAHAHNAVAVGVWLLLAAALHAGPPGLGAVRLAPAAAFGLGAAAILAGAFDPVLAATAELRLPGFPALATHARALAPGVAAPWATRLVAAFAFAQSVHYGLWLRVVPEEARDRAGTRSWRASFRAVRADLGDGPLAACLVALVGVAGWGLVDLAEAREGYLRLALFHGPLELAVLGLVAAEGRGALRP